MIGFHALHDLRRRTGPRCWAPHTQKEIGAPPWRETDEQNELQFAAFVGSSFEQPFSSQSFACACKQGHTASSVYVLSSLQVLLLHLLADAPVNCTLHRGGLHIAVCAVSSVVPLWAVVPLLVVVAVVAVAVAVAAAAVW